jgi:small subunit ribosomal protein S16
VAVKIKLKRMGKIHAPFYRIVVADARTKRDGRAIEEIGKYHPKSEPSFIEVASERAQYWLSVGAQPTEPVRRILEITGDWQKFRGEPGAEGTLRTAAPKTAKAERFAEAVGARPSGGETTPKGGGRARKPDTEAKQDKADGSARRKPAAKAAKPADQAGKPAGEAPKADAPKADAPKADAPQAEAPQAEAPRAETAATEEAAAEPAAAEPAAAEAAAAEEAPAAAAEPGSGG